MVVLPFTATRTAAVEVAVAIWFVVVVAAVIITNRAVVAVAAGDVVAVGGGGGNKTTTNAAIARSTCYVSITVNIADGFGMAINNCKNNRRMCLSIIAIFVF